MYDRRKKENGIEAKRGELQKQEGKIREMALIGLATALICIAGPLSLPLPFTPVPLSLTNLALCLAVCLLGMRRGCISCLLYLLLGLCGLPVFSGFSGGAGKLFGPTGGYLIGFVLLTAVGGFFAERQPSNTALCIAGFVIGQALDDLLGTVWLARQAQLPFAGALAAGVLPFIPGDLIKIVLAAIVGKRIRRRLQEAGLV